MTSRRPRVVVLDYGSGNLRSAQRALQRAGADAEISADTDAALRADGLIGAPLARIVPSRPVLNAVSLLRRSPDAVKPARISRTSNCCLPVLLRAKNRERFLKVTM